MALNTIASCHAIEPTHPARTTGGGAEFAFIAAMDAQLLCLRLVQNFGHELSRAHRRRIRFGHSDDVGDLMRRNAGAHRTVRRQRGRRGDHGINTEIGVFQSTELTFQEDVFALFQRVGQIHASVAHIRRDHIAILHTGVVQLFFRQQRLVVHMLQRQIFQRAHIVQLFAQIGIIEQLVHLNPDLGVFVAEERRDTAFGGAKRVFAQPFLFVFIKQDVIGHQDLRAIGHQQLRVQPRLFHIRQLFAEFLDIQRHAVADDAGGVVIAHPAGHQMEREASFVVDDGMTGVGAALKPHDNVRLFGKHIGDFAFALVAPVGADNCFNHGENPP